jgi:protein-tyrosine phosphatase
MIDLHCHFLPGIDDGAQNLDDGLALARAAAADGITYSVMTPHILPGRYDNTRSSIEQAFKDFRLALRKARIPLHIGMAAEVRLSPDIVALLSQNEVPFLGELNGYRIILLEFPHNQITPGADKLIEWLLTHRIRPLIAHPERNQDVIRDLSKIEPFVEMGCFLQITAGALVGHFGRAPQRRALELLEFDVFKVLASDAHNLTGRRPALREGMEAAARVIGEQSADDLVNQNPRMILRGAVAAVAR